MTTRITVWTLAWDTREGTNCKVFASEKELDSHVEQIVRNDLSAIFGEEVVTNPRVVRCGKRVGRMGKVV